MGIFKRFGVGASTVVLEPTSTPTTAVLTQTLNSVSFSVTNTDEEVVNIS